MVVPEAEPQSKRQVPTECLAIQGTNPMQMTTLLLGDPLIQLEDIVNLL